ncbi:hypothetical protein [Acinetobacter rudis]|uniref:hypothetical protein n=1 Tax=Acinetobacter rudis TaxID=632955 RepID=UPI003341D437
MGVGTPAQAQRKVLRGIGPSGVKRIDGPEGSVPNSQWHAHAQNDSALNLDGSTYDQYRGIPPFNKNVTEFLFCHGWNIP